MTPVDTEFMAIGNAGAMPAGAITSSPFTSDGNKGGPPLQIVIGAQKPAELYAYIRGLTPDNLSLQLEAFDRGMLRGIVPIWRKMRRRDGHLLSVSEKRLGRVAALEWKIVPKEESPAASAQAEYLKAFVENIPEFASRLEDLAEAIPFGIAGCEIEWLPNGGPDGRLGCRLWPQNHEDWDLTGGVARVFVANIATPLPPDKFLVHHLKVALMEPSSILFVMKLITAGQWLAFGEKFGMPGIIGTAPASASQDDVDKFYEMLCNWGQEFVAAMREGYSVATLPAGGANGQLTYPQLVEWADKEHSKIWTGHTVTSQGEAGSGTLAGNAGQEQLDDLVLADGMRLARSIEKCLCEPAVRFQFGTALLCNFVLVGEKPMSPADKAAEATTDAVLANQLGLKLPLVDVFAKFGWRQAEANEETTQPKDSGPALGAIPDPGADVAPTGQDLQTSQATVLNGAQITAATAIVTAVAAGTLPRDAGLGQLQVLFNLDHQQAETMMGTAGTTTPTQANPINGTEPAAVPAAFKTGGDDALAPARAAMTTMLQPLVDLVNHGEPMTPEEFKMRLLALKLPADALVETLSGALTQAVEAGRKQTIEKIAASLTNPPKGGTTNGGGV